MSSSRASAPVPAKRVAYKPPRDRREVVIAIAVASLIVIVTASLVWLLRPTDDSSSDSTPVITVPATTPTDTTTPVGTSTPGETSTPTDTSSSTPTTAASSPTETTAAPGG
jgi:hypothetical protein